MNSIGNFTQFPPDYRQRVQNPIENNLGDQNLGYQQNFNMNINPNPISQIKTPLNIRNIQPKTKQEESNIKTQPKVPPAKITHSKTINEEKDHKEKDKKSDSINKKKENDQAPQPGHFFCKNLK